MGRGDFVTFTPGVDFDDGLSGLKLAGVDVADGGYPVEGNERQRFFALCPSHVDGVATYGERGGVVATRRPRWLPNREFSGAAILAVAQILQPVSLLDERRRGGGWSRGWCLWKRWPWVSLRPCHPMPIGYLGAVVNFHLRHPIKGWVETESYTHTTGDEIGNGSELTVVPSVGPPCGYWVDAAVAAARTPPAEISDDIDFAFLGVGEEKGLS